jgi:hypothetical protein
LDQPFGIVAVRALPGSADRPARRQDGVVRTAPLERGDERMTPSSHREAIADGASGDDIRSGSSLLLRAGLFVGLLAAATVGITLVSGRVGGALQLAGNTTSRQPLDIVIGADHLRLPANMLRFEEQRRTGHAERVDLFVTWPEMDGYTTATSARFTDVNRPDGLIFLQISQSTMSKDMSGRIAPIYSHLFEGKPQRGPAGLTAHAMKAGSGYGAETFLTADPLPGLSSEPYGIRCSLPASPAESTSADCQRDIHAGQDLVVLYRFSSQLLPQWHAIDEAVRRFVAARLVP